MISCSLAITPFGAYAMMDITLACLVNDLLSLSKRGAFIVTLTCRTDARLLKTGNNLGPVEKISRVNGILNWHYETSVNRQQLREGSNGDFEAQPRKWGIRIPHTPFVTHKGKLYVELKVERSLGHEYVNSNGNILDKDIVAPFLPDKKSNAEHQGVEKEIILRDYSLGNVTEITYGGITYAVEPTTDEVVQMVANNLQQPT